MQDFFLRRLVDERGASARTIESYRDAFELLFAFIEKRTGNPPSALTLADLDAPLVLDFLDHLETERGNTTRTRNARLAAIHSFMRYACGRAGGVGPGCWAGGVLGRCRRPGRRGSGPRCWRPPR